MSNYGLQYALTHDIDLFLQNEEQEILHFASNGSSLAIHFDQQENEQIKHFILKSGDLAFVDAHKTDVLDKIIADSVMITNIETATSNYLSTFIMMAKLGFKSYDILGEKDGEYYAALIASPDQRSGSNSRLMNEVPHLDDVRIKYIENVEAYRKFRDDNYNDK